MTVQATVELGLPQPIESVEVFTGQADPAPQKAADDGAKSAKMAAEQLQSAYQALCFGAAELGKHRQDALADIEEQLFQLSLGIAAKILSQEIQADRYEIDPIVKEALCHMPAKQDVVIRLNPEDYAQCQMVCDGDQAGAGGQVRFIADATVEKAHCMVESPEGVVESSPQAHLANVAEILKFTE